MQPIALRDASVPLAECLTRVFARFGLVAVARVVRFVFAGAGAGAGAAVLRQLGDGTGTASDAAGEGLRMRFRGFSLIPFRFVQIAKLHERMEGMSFLIHIHFSCIYDYSHIVIIFLNVLLLL